MSSLQEIWHHALRAVSATAVQLKDEQIAGAHLDDLLHLLALGSTPESAIVGKSPVDR